MEPHATTAVWDKDGSLTLYETTQHIFGARELVSIVLGLPIEKIKVVCQFLGGGFGGKAYVWPHTLLAALAARVVGRPVKLQLTRAQMYTMAGHQPATIQSVVLGARQRRQADRHSPREHFADAGLRQLHRICRARLALAVGGERRHRDEPQNRACPPQHADRDARAARGIGAFRARKRDGRTRL